MQLEIRYHASFLTTMLAEERSSRNSLQKASGIVSEKFISSNGFGVGKTEEISYGLGNWEKRK